MSTLSSTTSGAVPPDLAVLDDPVELRRYTRFDTGAGGQTLADSSLRITGMHCAACAGLVEDALRRVPGVIEATVSAAGERARVRWQPALTRASALVQAVRAAGYGALPDAAADAREARRIEQRRALWQLFVAAFCAMQVMMMATPSYVAHGNELEPDLRQLLNWGSWLMSLPVLVFSCGPFFQGAWRSLRARRIGMDVPVALGIAVTFVASSGATFDPQGLFGHEVYFDSMTMFVSFLLGGRLLETRARHRVAQTLEAALEGMPQTAWRVAEDGTVESVSVQRLLPGDRVRVPAGQAFAADGVLIEGRTTADESLLSGESLPVAKEPGSTVVAGSLNLGDPVLMRVERVGDDTRLEAIVALMRDALTQRPALARLADRWAGPFLWAVLVLAAGSAAVWSVIDPSRAVWVAVSVLIVTCPCALSLAVPSALLSAARALARHGVLLQRLDALETLTRIDRLYLDKTGTVTEDRLSLGEVRLLPDAGEGPAGDASAQRQAALLAQAAALAGWSGHPLSRALAAAAEPSGTVWSDLREVAGGGLCARDAEGREWRLGSLAHVRPAADGTSPAWAEDDVLQDGPAVWLGREGRPLLHVRFDEVLRDGAAQTVAALQAEGLTLCLLSGDRAARARAMAQRLGLRQAIGDATPESKLAEVQAAQAAGHVVAMVGDGINDAPVLAQADISLAMGQGALVARAHADAVLVRGRLDDLLRARALARRTLRVVRQNLGWAAAYNAVCIPLAMAGWLPPWAAGLGMASSSLFVIGNSLRLAR
ncbi:MAG: hypothetical protein RLY78_1583 [Pseudomonadota bacterium]